MVDEFNVKLLNPNIDPKELKYRMETYISSSDIDRYIPGGQKNIITYSDLKNYSSIDDLLPNDKSYKIILIEAEENVGHWVLLMRYKYEDNTYIEFFNSYGLMPNTSLNFINKIKNILLGQNIKYLDLLLNDAKKKYTIVYSSKRFQKLDNRIGTCGRHMLLRLLTMLYYNFSLYDYIILIDKLKKEYKLSPDEIVSILIV